MGFYYCLGNIYVFIFKMFIFIWSYYIFLAWHKPGNLVSRNSALVKTLALAHLLLNSGGIACWIEEQHPLPHFQSEGTKILNITLLLCRVYSYTHLPSCANTGLVFKPRFKKKYLLSYLWVAEMCKNRPTGMLTTLVSCIRAFKNFDVAWFPWGAGSNSASKY